MTYPKVFDASIPPGSAPGNMTGVLGYIGGNTPHIWTPAEWQPFAHLRQFPIWVPFLDGDPVAQGADAATEAKRRGWAAHLPKDETRVIVIDLETAQVPEFYAAMAAAIITAGFVPVCYGSLSTVLGNAATAVWAADWDGITSLPPGQVIHGVQYDAGVPFGGTVVDFSVFDPWLMARGGLGARHGA